MGTDSSNPTPSPQTQPSSTKNREAFFLTFSHETRKRYPTLTLLLTGGFRTRAGAEAALSQNACDLIGIGRPAAIAPHFPALMLDEESGADEAGLKLGRVRDQYQGAWVGRVVGKVVGVVLGGMVKGVGAGMESVSFSLFFFSSRFILSLCEGGGFCRCVVDFNSVFGLVS